MEFNISKPAFNVLFLCAGNSSRSQMAEALLNVIGNGRFRAFSAGCPPCRDIHPYVIEQLTSIDYPILALRSQSWEEFACQTAPKMDFVINVCTHPIPKDCPVQFGESIQSHWYFQNPDDLISPPHLIQKTFRKVFKQLEVRLRLFNALPLEALERRQIQQELYLISKSLVYENYD